MARASALAVRAGGGSFDIVLSSIFSFFSRLEILSQGSVKPKSNQFIMPYFSVKFNEVCFGTFLSNCLDVF